MAEKSPLVFVDGGFSQLPPGDSIEGVALGSLVAGSGLVGGGDLNTGNKRLDIGLTASPSGIIFVGDALGLDGVDLATAQAALASGNAGLELGAVALASGVAAQSEANNALASGNAALDAAANFVGSSSLTFTAASAVASGYAVGLDDTGKVQTIRLIPSSATRSFGTPSVFKADTTTEQSSTYDSSNNRVVVGFRDPNNSNYGTAVVGTVSGLSISFGTPVVFESAYANFITLTYDSANSRVVIVYSDTANSYRGTAIVGTVSGTSISFGSPVIFDNTVAADDTTVTYDSTNGKIVVFYLDANITQGFAVVGTVSGTSISFGSRALVKASFVSYTGITFDSTNSKVVAVYRDTGNSNYGTASVGTVSGTSISFGTAVVFESATSTFWESPVYDSTNNRVVIAYRDNGNSSYGTAIVGTVSGTSISFGTAVVFNSFNTAYTSLAYDNTYSQIVLSYGDNGNSGYGTCRVGTVSGTSITFTTATVFESAAAYHISSTYNSITGNTVISYTDNGNFNYGTSIVAGLGSAPGPTINTQNNFIGIAQATVASGTDVNVLLPRAIDFNQTGLSPGYFYYVNPTTSGFTTASGQPTGWSGAYNWGPVAKAVSSSGLLLLNPI